jgi:hypothetical protein
MQLLKVEEMTLQVAERRKRVPEQVKMLLDDAIQRQSALADRIEFESQDDDSAMEGMEQGRGKKKGRKEEEKVGCSLHPVGIVEFSLILQCN